MPPSTSVPLRKFPPGTSLPIRNVPSPVYSKETETEPPPHYLEWAASRQLKVLGPISRWYADQSRTVEEYAGESIESATGETFLTVVPDYEPASEVITEVLVTGPPQTPFVLQLGDRYMTLVTDITGMCLLAEVFFRLKPTSKRTLTAGSQTVTTTRAVGGGGAIVAATAGNATLPAGSALTGFTITLSTVGTAAMIVTVTNTIDTYTYNIPAGVSSLSVTFPAPLVATPGAQPSISWSATAAAVGNAEIYGTLATSSPVAAGSWLLHMSGYALARNET